ncbi:LGFP repeat protein [compost metagenome]
MADETGDGNGLWWQKFSNGYIIGSAEKGYYESTGSIRKKWAESGYQKSPVGIPTENIMETSTNCYSQAYTNGVIKGCSGKYEIILQDN